MAYRALAKSVCVVLLMLAASCGEEPAAEPVDAPFAATATDSDGREITFDKPPVRIVAYDSVTVEVLFAMGEGARVVGTHDFASYPPEVEQIPRVGGYFDVNVEKIVELEPDLVNIWFNDAVEALENAGEKVLYLREPESLNGISDRIRLWGRITGNLGSAETAAAVFESRLDALRDRISSIDTGPRFFHDTALGFWTTGPDTLLGQVYTLLKGQNIADDLSGYAQLSKEVLVERDPEVIIAAHPDLVEAYYDDPALKGITAVREKRIETIDPDLISVAGPRYADAIEQLVALVYPDLP